MNDLIKIAEEILTYIEGHLALITAILSVLSLILIAVRIHIEKKILSKFGLQEFYKKATITELLSDYLNWIVHACLGMIFGIIYGDKRDTVIFLVEVIIILRLVSLILCGEKIVDFEGKIKNRFKKKRENERIENSGTKDIDCQIEENIESCNSDVLFIAYLIIFVYYTLRITFPSEKLWRWIIIDGIFIILFIFVIIFFVISIFETIGEPFYSSGTYKEIEHNKKEYAVVYTSDDKFCCLRSITKDNKLMLLVNENYIASITDCEFTRKEYTKLNILSEKAYLKVFRE